MSNAGIAAISEADSHVASRHGSPRRARPSSSRAGIESGNQRQHGFRIPARLDSDAGLWQATAGVTRGALRSRRSPRL